MNETKLITNDDVQNALSAEHLIPFMRDIFKGTSTGKIKMLPRNSIFHPNGNILAIMTASLPDFGVCGCKTAIFPGPKAAGTTQSAVILFDTVTGALKGIVAAEYITVIRTAASTAAATDVLAREDSHILCLLGAGTQALAHAQAICDVRPITEIRFWDLTLEGAQAACNKIAEKIDGISVHAYTSAEEAVKNADIVCTVSKAKEPILQGEWISPGTHVNAVGACGPIFRELDSSVLEVSRVFVDEKNSAMASAGDLLIPIKEGTFSENQIAGEIGEVISGTCVGRQKETEITVFETCGLAAQDVGAAYLAWKNVDGDKFVF